MFAGGPERRETQRKQLVDSGILLNEPIFGNKLADMPKYKRNESAKMATAGDTQNDVANAEEDGLPEFVVRCIKKIEAMNATVGIYRINGDQAKVQGFR